MSNFFFSPYSLCTALSLLDVGAGTETKTELEEMLGITDLNAWNAAIKAYLEKPWAEETFVLTANSVWMQQGKEWSESMETAFLQPAGFYYNSELYEVDFLGNNEAVTEQVNAWAERNTNGMIPKVMDKVPTDTVMALMNAVYFEGKWETPFDPDDTYEQTFYGTDGERKVEMMHQYNERYAYVESNGIKGIALPYKEAGVVMKIFLPILPDEHMGIVEDGMQAEGEDDNAAASRKQPDIEELFAALSTEEKEALLDSLDVAPKEEITRLAVPKFTMELGIDGLVEILQDMGMETAFLPEADFDSIAEDIFVTDVIHKAKIEMDEDGTKAAAVTVVTMTESAAMIEEPPIIFEADRPFVYFLQDTETGMILFMGRVNNPE